MAKKEYFPDGTPIEEWFHDDSVPSLDLLGKHYVLTDYGIMDDGKVHTGEFQALIDLVAKNGGGLIVVPDGIYLTGSLFFKQGVNLYVSSRGMIKGSDDISDYALMDTRIEGQNCRYFAALINIDGVDGLTICGNGAIDGNGLRSWKAFWKRREWNPECTNKDEQRARLIAITNSKNVIVAGLHIQNAQFWTNHIYKSDHIKYLDCKITSPAAQVPAPSTDAIDIDASSDILIKNCYMSVNDDAVVMKGGKGPDADVRPENGISERVIIEDCTFGFNHACFTCGSESIHSKNVIIRNCTGQGGHIFFRLKMRSDTPQLYEYITVENVDVVYVDFIDIKPWTQFHDMAGKTEIPMSVAKNITFKNCKGKCVNFFDVSENKELYELSDLKFVNIDFEAENPEIGEWLVKNLTRENVNITEISCCEEIRNNELLDEEVM